MKRLRVMRKMNKIAMSVIAVSAVFFVSCQMNEEDFKVHHGTEDEIAFRIGPAQTRSVASEEAKPSDILTLRNEVTGQKFVFEETLEELNPGSKGLATRGAPAYTVNVAEMYKAFNAYVTNASGTKIFDNGDFTFNKDDEFWVRRFYQNPWKDADPLYFFMYMPTDMTSNGVTLGSDAYSIESGKQKIKFTYKSKPTGADQQDIIFAARSLAEDEYDAQQGADILFHHALTGVKFRVANDNTGTTKTLITKVVLTGLKDQGTCTITYDNATGTNATVVWTPGSSTGTFTQEFANPKYTPADSAKNSDGTINYDKTNEDFKDKFGDTWYAAADSVNTKNLNDTTGALTFWFIPQTLNSDVKLTVYFRVKTPDTPDGTEIEVSTNFGEKLSNVEWKAGQLRTYSLRPTDVDVEIFDTMKGWKKDSLHVTNTGNVDEYVRMMVVGNWYDKDGNILVGYKYAGNEDPSTLDEGDDIDTMIVPWFREDDTPGYDYGSYFDDTFKYGRPASGSKWVRGTGSYFYYTEVIGAGDKLSGTESLFKKYEYPSDKVPTIYVPSTTSNVRTPAEGVHLVMEVVVQAIGTIDPDGNPYEDCWAAWTAATGETIKEKPFKN